MKFRLWLVGLLLRKVAAVHKIDAGCRYIILVDKHRMLPESMMIMAREINGLAIPVYGNPNHVVSLYKISA